MSDIWLWLVVVVVGSAVIGGGAALAEWLGIAGGRIPSRPEDCGPTRPPRYSEGDTTYTLCGYRAVCEAADWDQFALYGGAWEYLFVIHGPEGERRYFYDEYGSIQNRGHTTDRLLDLVEPADNYHDQLDELSPIERHLIAEAVNRDFDQKDRTKEGV